jgi:hypothetical protein
MNELNYDIIDQYLRGELKGEDLQDFEKQLAENNELTKEVALYKNIEDEMSLHFSDKNNEQALSNNLKNLNTQYFLPSQKNKVIQFNKWWLLAAAGVIAIIVLVVNPFSSSTPFNNETLYAYHTINVEPLPSVERGSNEDSTLITATNFYNQKKYAESLPILIDITTKNPKEKQLQLAVGVCYLKTEKLTAALAIFNSLSKEETIFKDKATWYKALVFLKQNKLDESSNTFQLISPNADDYKAAKKLIQTIESNKQYNH